MVALFAPWELRQSEQHSESLHSKSGALVCSLQYRGRLFEGRSRDRSVFKVLDREDLPPLYEIAFKHWT